MARTRYVQRALACQECAADHAHQDACDRPSTGQPCKHCIRNNKPCTPPPEEELLEHFATLRPSLVPRRIDTTFKDAINAHVMRINAIFCAVMQFAALNKGATHINIANKYNAKRHYFYRQWTDSHTTSSWPEDVKPYLLYLLLLGPTLVAMNKSPNTRFNRNPAVHMAMINRALCIAWGRVTQHLDLVPEDSVYSKLLSSNLLKGVPITGENLDTAKPVVALRAVLDKQGLSQEANKNLYLAITNSYRVLAAMICADGEVEDGRPNDINRWIPAWLSVNSDFNDDFWNAVNVDDPSDVFRIIQGFSGTLFHRAGVWWCEGISDLLFDDFRGRLHANPGLRTPEYM
ncbi:hypothetical protein KCU93_g8447, partial [Aureobasidium melanogenum]